MSEEKREEKAGDVAGEAAAGYTTPPRRPRKLGEGVAGDGLIGGKPLGKLPADAPAIEKVDLSSKLPETESGKLAFMLYNVFTPEECKRLVEHCEGIGFEAALLNIGGGKQVLATDVRSNTRVMLDDPVIATDLFERLKPFIPATWHGWHAVGVNERLRVLRYFKGEFFASHYDGCFTRDRYSSVKCGKEGDTSFITVQCYLNEGYKGGTTRFLNRWNAEDYCDAPAKVGSVLIFEHDILHEGHILYEGTKYAVRTDVMYRAGPAPGEKEGEVVVADGAESEGAWDARSTDTAHGSDAEETAAAE